MSSAFSSGFWCAWIGQRDWALIVISSLIGGYYLTSMFRLAQIPRVLITAGLIIIGAVVQAIIMRQQKQ